VSRMSYGMYGRGYGRGLGLGLGPNLSPYCRWFPDRPRGWWANPAYASQTNFPPANMMSQPNFGMMTYQRQPYQMPYQYPSQFAYPPQTTTLPPATPQQFQPRMLPQQPFYAPQMQYGPGAGMGMGIGMGWGFGMGMRYRRGMGHFGGGAYQY
jgi:hypothetical protein